MSLKYNKIGWEKSIKENIYWNIDRIKYSTKKDKSTFHDSNSSSISKYDESLSDARKRHNNFLSALINSR